MTSSSIRRAQEHTSESIAYRQLVPLLLPLGVPGDHGVGAQDGVDPGDQLEALGAGIQTHDARADAQEPDGQLQQGASEGRIVDGGRREEDQQPLHIHLSPAWRPLLSGMG
jgi:hypothetical protein